MMSKSTCHSRLSSTATTPDLDFPNLMESSMDTHRPSTSNDRRPINVNYVRQVLRKFFGNYGKKYSSSQLFDEISAETSPTINSTSADQCVAPMLIHPCLHVEKRTKFSGELLLDWFLLHFENRQENLHLIRQVIVQCCTCLISLGVLRLENDQTNEFFQAQNLYSWSTNIDDEEINVKLSSPTRHDDVHPSFDIHAEPNRHFRPTTANTILDILKNEYGIHSDTQPVETVSISTQVELCTRVEQATQTDLSDSIDLSQSQQKCFVSESIPMSSKTESDCETASSLGYRCDELNLRQAMQKLILYEKVNDSSSSFSLTDANDDDTENEVPSSLPASMVLHSSSSFKNNHAKFTGELLLEWLRLNSDPRSPSTQTLIQQVQTCSQTNNTSNTNEDNLEKVLTSSIAVIETTLLTVHEQEHIVSPVVLDQQIQDDVQALLSDLITRIDTESPSIDIPLSTAIIPPPPPPPPFFTNLEVSSIPSPPPPPPFPDFLVVETTTSESHIPPAPPLPESMGPPPAPPLPSFLRSTAPPPPPPLSPFLNAGVPPPPPPPPFPGFGGPPPPPPPPPFPGFGTAPVAPSSGGPPPPPPPPPMMPGFGAPPQLPTFLRKKHKYALNEPVKKVQWSKINPYTIKKDSLWVTVDEEKYINDELFSDLRKHFASKIAPSRQPIHDLVDKSKELRVLDAKAAQNFAIMFSQLKAPPSVFREWMLSCDNEYLKDDFLKQLEKYLPTAEELKTLADFKNEINDLQYSEQYFCAIGDIKRLKQRLKTLLFKSNYKETVEETDKALVEVRTACDHVRHSIRFKKMLELILTVGNYMNSSAKTYEPVHGFDISFLPKLHSTKANDGRRSLLHFIVQAIEEKHRDLLAFSDEFFSLADGVSKINLLELQKQPQEIQRELKCAREELTIAKSVEEPIEADRFAASIEDFLIRADDDVARLEQLDGEMTQSYQNLCDFLSVDAKNYSLTEFFTDLKTFCTLFSTCLQEVRAWREQAARAVKTSNTQSSIEKKIPDTPDDSTVQRRRPMSRIEDLIEKRKSNRGLTPSVTPTKKRSQS